MISLFRQISALCLVVTITGTRTPPPPLLLVLLRIDRRDRANSYCRRRPPRKKNRPVCPLCYHFPGSSQKSNIISREYLRNQLQ